MHLINLIKFFFKYWQLRLARSDLKFDSQLFSHIVKKQILFHTEHNTWLKIAYLLAYLLHIKVLSMQTVKS